MIEKFNFYDVYGYFLPGAAFLAVLWMPLGLVRHSWPAKDWSSAIIAAALAYLVGHLLQNVATNAIPSWESKGAAGNDRYPSEIFLDFENNELPKEAKKKIGEFIELQFGLNLQLGAMPDAAIDKTRNNAFLFARQTLIQGSAVSYAEQFQGMYAVTRGLVSVFALACTYFLGWAAAVLKHSYAIDAGIVLMCAAILALFNLSLMQVRGIANPLAKRRVEIWYASLLLALLFAVGYVLGIHSHVELNHAMVFAFLAGCSGVACLRAYGAYRYFARRFASTVWRDYLAYNIRPASKANGKTT